MGIELSYVLITPYTILKSRTGGVMARLLSRTDLELVGTQMFAPTEKLANDYAEYVYLNVSKKDVKSAALLRDYILQNFPPVNERKRRVMMLLFKGENAAGKLYSIVGGIYPGRKTKENRITGETIRDTYSDLVFDEKGEVKYFEPAVLTPPDREHALGNLKLFADFMGSESNLIENMQYEDDDNIQRTLIIIKPDNWRYPSSKPGNIIDMFSRTSLRIIGCKIYQMTVGEALEFYGPVKSVLREKLAPKIGEQAKTVLEKEFKIKLNESDAAKLTEIAGIAYADDQFSQIVEFMSGIKPESLSDNKMNEPGLVKSMVLIYEGKNAVKKIRDVLGPTDPTKAPSGTIRKEFGHNIMVNTAHASDSVESAVREMRIVKIQKNTMSSVIKQYLSKTGN